MSFFNQEELRRIIRQADLYVHCATVEIEGMGCMEAFSQGIVPIIADSELSSTAEYALTEKNKYKAGNLEDLISKIEYWYEHRDSLYTLGCEYIELAKSLSIEKSAQKVIRMMKEAIESQTIL